MTPIYQIMVGNGDITGLVADRLLSLKVTDEAGIRSDSVEFQLDDRDNAIELPHTGAELSVSMGYRETGLARMGVYIVDEIVLSGPTRTLTIRGKAANMPKTIKAPKTRPWDDATLGTLVASIAAEHGLTPQVSEEMAGIALPHLDQTEESDLHLLTRLAKQFDGVAKPAGGRLLMVKREQWRSAIRKKIPAVNLSPAELSSWQVTLADRDHYGSVTADWHDKGAAKRITVKAGDGPPVYKMRKSYPDAAQAQETADATLALLNRGTGKLNITLPGNPALMAEGTVNMSGFRTGVDGPWLINRVSHTLNSRGYTTSLDAETPKS